MEVSETNELEPASRPSYAGIPIVKRTLALGMGGSAEVPPELLHAQPRSTVYLDAIATLGSTKHKFTNEGVEEYLILTIDPESVGVYSVRPPTPRPVQETIDDALAQVDEHLESQYDESQGEGGEE